MKTNSPNDPAREWWRLAAEARAQWSPPGPADEPAPVPPSGFVTRVLAQRPTASGAAGPLAWWRAARAVAAASVLLAAVSSCWYFTESRDERSSLAPLFDPRTFDLP